MKTAIMAILLSIGFLSAGAFAGVDALPLAKHQNVTIVFKNNFNPA
jgi:hypothetical protein